MDWPPPLGHPASPPTALAGHKPLRHEPCPIHANMWKQLTKRQELPRWFWLAMSVVVSALLLWISLSWVQWKLHYGFQKPTMWDGGSQRCFDNAQPFMPFAAFLHSIFCSGTDPFTQFINSRRPEFFARLCLYGGVVVVWLAARAMSGWWAAGISAAYIATSPLLFALDTQVSPASFGILAVAVSCWVAIEAFGQPERRASVPLRYVWAAAALIAVSLYISTVWLILAQALYGYSRSRSLALERPALITAAAGALMCAVFAFVPKANVASSIVRADVRALPVDLFAFSWPDLWLSQPHMATYLSIAFVVVMVCGAFAARSTVLPFLVAALVAEVFFGLVLSDDTLVKITSMGSATIVMTLTLGALTQFLIQRKPHMLAFVIPAFAVAAQYAAFERMPLLDDGAYDFDSTVPPPISLFAAYDRAILYHDAGHGERITVHQSMDGYVNKRDQVSVPANTPVAVSAVIPYRMNRGISYAYEVVADDSGRKWFASDDAMWIRPNDSQCVRQPYSKVRLYDIPNPAFREDGHSVLEPPGTIFRVDEVQTHPYEPELKVDITEGPAVGKTGWIYAQILLRGGEPAGQRAMHFPCS